MIKFTNRKRDNIYEETCALHKFYSIKFNTKNISGMLCVEGRSQRSVGEVSCKQKRYSYFGLLLANSFFLISSGIDHKTMNIFNVHAFLSLTVMIIIEDQKYEKGSNGRQISRENFEAVR